VLKEGKITHPVVATKCTDHTFASQKVIRFSRFPLGFFDSARFLP
jgi:hypothetical protein